MLAALLSVKSAESASPSRWLLVHPGFIKHLQHPDNNGGGGTPYATAETRAVFEEAVM